MRVLVFSLLERRWAYRAQARRELHFAIDYMIVRDEPANETDNDGRRRCRSISAGK